MPARIERIPARLTTGLPARLILIACQAYYYCCTLHFSSGDIGKTSTTPGQQRTGTITRALPTPRLPPPPRHPSIHPPTHTHSPTYLFVSESGSLGAHPQAL